MGSRPTPRDWSAAVKSAAVAAAWLVLGLIWLGMIVAVAELVHAAVASVWAVSGFALAIAVGWWIVRAWQTPRRVVVLACWWFLAALVGPLALVLVLPWFRSFRNWPLAWIERSIGGDARPRPWASLVRALGDPRRPWRVSLLFVVSIATFPMFWFVTIILLALGSAGEVTDEDSLSMQRFAVVVGAVVSAIAVTAAIFDAVSGRRRYPEEERDAFRGVEGVICGGGILLALGAAVVFGEWTWNTVLLV